MSQDDIQSRYLSLEGFFIAHANELSPMVGERAAQYAWGLKDLDSKNEDAELSCRRVQSSVEKRVAGTSAEWVLMVSESHEILSLEEWIEHVLKDSKVKLAEVETGYGDLDLNIETQLACGMQLESFHSADWAKARLNTMFSPEAFSQLEPLVCKLSMPLPQVIDKLDRDLEFAIKAGMRHPYKCSLAVGAVCLRIPATDSEPERLVPVIRRMRSSDIGEIVAHMKVELKDRFKGLVTTIKEQQEHLKLLPEGWPNAEVWATMQDWSSKRFVGDNGLVGSDFFDGAWLVKELPHDVHRHVEVTAVHGLEATASFSHGTPAIADRISRRRAAGVSTASSPSVPASRL
jgi:hypothetical protein